MHLSMTNAERLEEKQGINLKTIDLTTVEPRLDLSMMGTMVDFGDERF